MPGLEAGKAPAADRKGSAGAWGCMGLGILNIIPSNHCFCAKKKFSSRTAHDFNVSICGSVIAGP